MAYRRAGGRRRFNAERRRTRDARRERITALILAAERPCVASYQMGFAPRLASLFGVSRSTIVRDLSVIRKTLVLPDPCCEHDAQLEAEWKERERLNEASLRRYYGRFLPPDAVDRILAAERQLLEDDL